MNHQEPLHRALVEKFGNANVEHQFNIVAAASDGYEKGFLYTPIPDFAIRPFNLDRDKEANVRSIEQAFRDHSQLIGRIASNAYEGNALNFGHNPNPRLFIEIEVENKNTEKHTLGSIINASLLGKIGILVGATPEAYELLTRIKSYLKFVEDRKGLSLGANVVVIRMESLIGALEHV